MAAASAAIRATRSRHSSTGRLTVTPTTSYGAGSASARPATRPACVPHEPVASHSAAAAHPVSCSWTASSSAGRDVAEGAERRWRRRGGRRTGGGPPPAARRRPRRRPRSTEDRSASPVNRSIGRRRARRGRGCRPVVRPAGRRRSPGGSSRGRGCGPRARRASPSSTAGPPPVTRQSQPCAQGVRDAGTPGRGPCCRRGPSPVRSSRLSQTSTPSASDSRGGRVQRRGQRAEGDPRDARRDPATSQPSPAGRRVRDHPVDERASPRRARRPRSSGARRARPVAEPVRLGDDTGVATSAVRRSAPRSHAGHRRRVDRLVRDVLADPVGERAHHRLGHRVAALGVEVGRASASASTCSPSSSLAAKPSAARGEQAALRQHQPLGLPAAAVALVQRHHALEGDAGVAPGRPGRGCRGARRARGCACAAW